MDILTIKELRQNKENYFFSFSSEEDHLICGGPTYGQIEFIIDNGKVVIWRTTSDGSGSSMLLSPLIYTNLMEIYQEVILLNKDIEVYLKDSATADFQDEKREILMRNVEKILPKHSMIQ